MTTQSVKYSPLFTKLFRSRSILLDILKDKRGFDISQYDEIGTKELRDMWDNKQLDMLLTNGKTKKKIFIKYHLDGKIKASHIYDYIEEIFEIDNTLSNEDELIIIIKDSINDTMKSLLGQIYINDKKFINLYDINSYLFNILDHEMIPVHTVLTDEEKEKIIQKYYITDESKFPEISRFDPVAQAIGARPGELVQITRSSPTAITSLYYRICK